MEFENNFDRGFDEESPAEAGFKFEVLKETEEMMIVRGDLIDALRRNDTEKVRELGQEYHDWAEARADEQEDNRGRIELMMITAQIWKEAGDVDECVAEMKGALQLAIQNVGKDREGQSYWKDKAASIAQELLPNQVEAQVQLLREMEQVHWGMVAADLEKLQVEANPPMGVSVARAIAVCLRRGRIEDARQVALIDGDKLEQYPKIKGHLVRSGLWGRSI